MKKFALIATLLLVMLGALIVPAAAQDDTHALAQYFPAEAPIYLEFRTDDEFIQSLDELAAQLSALIPDMAMSGSLMDMIDQSIAQIDEEGSFATTVRPWLGDQAAFGLYALDEAAMNSDEAPVVLVISITDEEKAADFLTLTNADDDYSVSEEDGYTLYSPDSGDTRGEPYFIFRDEVLIITSSPDMVAAGGLVDGGLNTSEEFSTAANMLPADAYGVFGYINTPVLFNAAMSESMGSRGMAEFEMIAPLLDAIQPQSFGLTQLGDRSLVIDFASPIELAAGSPFTMTPGAPIDPAFAEHIPANSVLVVHGTNLYQSYQSGMESLTAMSDMMTEMGNDDFDPQDLQTAIWGLGFAVRGLTGLEMDEALGWMTGDYAFAVALSPSFADASSVMGAMDSLPVDFGLVIDATEADGAQQLYDGLSRSLSGLPTEEVVVTEETLDGGVKALVFTITPQQSSSRTEILASAVNSIEILAATGNGVFAVGTRRMVEAAINPQNGLDSDADFAAAGETLLTDANALLYVSARNLQPLARVMSATGNPESLQDEGKQLKAILGLFSSLSISAAVDADNGGVSRFVWTLPE